MGVTLFLAGINENGIPHYSIIYLRSSDRVYTSKAPGHIIPMLVRQSVSLDPACWRRSLPTSIFWCRARHFLPCTSRAASKEISRAPSHVSPARRQMKYLSFSRTANSRGSQSPLSGMLTSARSGRSGTGVPRNPAAAQSRALFNSAADFDHDLFELLNWNRCG